MKKFLFTCFPALLCLPVTSGIGSASTLDQVVQSPNAEHPKGSAPYRGGDSRSDYSSFADFGLVDKYQDLGAGKEGAVSLPAPVTVFAGSSQNESRTLDTRPDSKITSSPVAHLPRQIEAPTIIESSVSRPPYAYSLVSKSYGFVPKNDSIRIGDSIPSDLVFRAVLNTDSNEIRLSDYRGKYLILQFWATWCTASSGFLLQAEAIQQYFGDRVKVLPITYESKAQVAKTLELRKSLEEINLPLITEETQLRKYFPHITLPHLVLIDPDGRVRAITGAQDMTIAKLSTLLQTGLGSFRQKVDKRIPFDIEDKLISGNPQIPSKNIRFQSALTQYIPGVDGASMENLADGTHLLFVNTSLIKLYRHAYTGRDLPNYFGFNRILTEGFEDEELTTSKSGLDYQEWMEKGDRVFGYELIAPPGVDGYALMREDLKRFFPHIEAKVELRPRMVWALVQQEGKSYPRSNSTKSYQVQPGTARLRNSMLTGFIYQLNLYFMQRSPYPVMDRTGIDFPIDIDLEANFSRPEELKSALNKTGLDLVLREESIPVLILSKRNPQNPINP